jgi:hypothetical protein
MNAPIRRDPTLALFATLMSMDHDPAIALFAAVAAHHGETWVPSDAPKFGVNALRVNGKIYAALTPSVVETAASTRHGIARDQACGTLRERGPRDERLGQLDACRRRPLDRACG